MKRRNLLVILMAMLGAAAALGLLHAKRSLGQSVPVQTIPPARIYTAFAVIPISATAASNTAAVLTIAAPSNSAYSNYVCYLAIEGSNDNTATVVTNGTTSSTNFNSFAAKFSVPSAASNDTGVLVFLNESPPGCAKSAAAGTATTFTSPTSAHEQYTWYATYLQGP